MTEHKKIDSKGLPVGVFLCLATFFEDEWDIVWKADVLAFVFWGEIGFILMAHVDFAEEVVMDAVEVLLI